MSRRKIDIYSDGSGNSFDSDGGWGFVMVVDGVKLKEGSGYLTSATNNVAELTAAIQGLKYVDAYIQAANINDYEVTLISDSQLTLGYASGLYKCKAIHLGPLNIELKKYYNKLSATTKWVKGHSGDQYNEICDQLAGQARAQKKSVS